MDNQMERGEPRCLGSTYEANLPVGSWNGTIVYSNHKCSTKVQVKVSDARTMEYITKATQNHADDQGLQWLPDALF